MLPITRPSPAALAALSLLSAIAPIAPLARAAQEAGGEKPQTERREQEAEPRSAAEILADVERLRLELVTASRPWEELLAGADALVGECRGGMDGLQPEHSKARALAEPLFEARLLRAEFLAALGRYDEAKSEIDANDALAGEDAKRESRRARARAALARQSDNTASDRAAQDATDVAKDALDRGNLTLVRELGAIAIPALREWITAHAREFPTNLSEDPVALLVDLDRRGSGAFLLRSYDRGDYLWRKRIARVLRHKDVLQYESDWSGGSEVPRASHLPEWLELLERLVEDPDLGAEVIPKLQYAIQYHGITPRLQAAMTAVLSVDDARRDALKQLIRRGGDYGEDMRPVLESAVAHPDAATRISAAGVLLDFEESDALLARADDPDVAVREAVTRWFTSRNVTGRQDPYLPSLDGRREILVRLAQDESPQVRLTAMHAVLDHAASLDDSMLDPFTRDPDAEVRAAFIGFLAQHVPLGRWARFATAMANDPDERVIESIDVQIRISVQNRSFAGIFDVLDARMRSTRHPWRSRIDQREVEFYLHQLAKIPEGRNGLAKLAIERSDEQLLRATFDDEALFELAPELLQDYVQRVFASDLGAVVEMTKQVFHPDDERVASSRGAVARELVALARDTSLDPRLRLILASAAPAEASDLVVDAAIATFTDPRWKPGGEWGDPAWLASLTTQRLARLSDRELNRIVIGTLVREGAEPALRRIAGELLRPLAPDGLDAVQLVLATMLDDPVTSEGVWWAVDSLGSVALPSREEILRTVAASGRYVDAAARAMARSRDARFIPDLARILLDPRLEDGWDEPLQALGSFLTDEAAEALLNVSAQITDAERRAAVLSAVADIRTYQEARERWSSRRVAQRTREQAAGELVGMLSHSDPEIRGEAARGLATLGAVEAIPELIRLLQDASPEVQASARAALERLHRRAELEEAAQRTEGREPPTEPPAPGGGATGEGAGGAKHDDGE